jgi:methylamine---glutamate N-methyltransferase subunit B
MIEVNLDAVTTRELNARLHRLPRETNERAWRLLNPKGKHSLAVGLTVPVSIFIEGHVGYYCGGMNKEAEIVIDGHAGTGLGENIMSGTIRVRGNASASAGASCHGGLIVIEGDAASRCGISMKGVDIVVGGSVGHMSAFMAQAGALVVCGDAGPDLGDSIYEAELFVGGRTHGLGADCEEKEPTPERLARLAALLKRAGFANDPRSFRCFGSARRLYHFHVDHAGSY